jgi:hypothetical protein
MNEKGREKRRQQNTPSTTGLGGTSVEEVPSNPLGRADSLAFSHSDTHHGDDSKWHPVLRPMRDTCERMICASQPRGLLVLSALSVLNDRRSFWRPAAHWHFGSAQGEAGHDT